MIFMYCKRDMNKESFFLGCHAMVKDKLSRQDRFRARFVRLVGRWKNAQIVESSASRIVEHPAYLEIVSMGEKVLPLILDDIATTGQRHWAWALRAITHENPVSVEASGRLAAQNEAWLKWGREKNLVSV
jgi:hypothetical protein